MEFSFDPSHKFELCFNPKWNYFTYEVPAPMKKKLKVHFILLELKIPSKKNYLNLLNLVSHYSFYFFVKLFFIKMLLFFRLKKLFSKI